MITRRQRISILCALSIIAGIAYAKESTSSTSVRIPLAACTGTPFYCLSVGGAALKQPQNIHFDTGGNVLIIPKDCLNPGGYQIVPGQPADLTDPWGNPSQLVQGEISLLDQGKVVATLKNFQFLAGTNGTCETGFSNFGAGFDFYTYPLSGSSAHNLPNKSKSISKNVLSNVTPPLRYNDSDSGCIGSFFAFYAAANNNTENDTVSGFAIEYINSKLYLTLGPAVSNVTGQTFQFTPQPPRQCGGQENMIQYFGATGSTWTGPSVNGFLITIAGLPINPTQIHSKKAANIDQDGAEIMMIDTGGGMLIAADDAQMSIAQEFVSSGNAAICPANITWLANCFCLKSGLTVNISSASNPAVSYHYTTTDVSQDESRAAAICPPWQYGSVNPYIAPNSFNSGAQLFLHMGVIFDFKNGKLTLNPSLPAPATTQPK